jgi:hypothetical protein
MNVILTDADKSIAIFWNTGGKKPVFQLQARNQLVSADGKNWEVSSPSLGSYRDCCLLLSYSDENHCGLLESRGEKSVFRLDAKNLLSLPTRLRKKVGSLFSVARFKLGSK